MPPCGAARHHRAPHPAERRRPPSPAEAVEGGVAAVRVVPALDEFGNSEAGVHLSPEAFAIEQLARERARELSQRALS